MSLVRGLLLSVLLAVLANRSCDCHLDWIQQKFGKLKVDVEDLQKTSSCGYTVESVTVPHGCLFKQLYHVKCTNIGDQCIGPDEDHQYMCVQTFKTINLNKQVLTPVTLYTGCVCAHKAENNLENSTRHMD